MDKENKEGKPERCGRECEVYSRVVGYFRPTREWNVGKQEEFKDRKNFAVPGKDVKCITKKRRKRSKQ